MLRQSLLLLKSHSLLIDPKGKKALAIGHCNVSDVEKDLDPSVKSLPLSMSEMV